MNGSMEQLYQQVILDHAKYPHGKGLVEVGTDDLAHLHVGESHQVNPTCGDEVTLRVDVDTTGDVARVRGVSWEGQGCSISQASVSVLVDTVTGATLSDVARASEEFGELMRSRGAAIDLETQERLGDAAAFAGVSKYPARVKCALLGWMALQDALIKAEAAQ